MAKKKKSIESTPPTAKKNVKGATKKVVKKTAKEPGPICNVVPDGIDLRDRPYMPPVAILPASSLYPKVDLPVLDQRDTNACTGFALASVVYYLQRSGNFDPARYRVSPFMMYSMARRYDEFPGNPAADTGSSLRGALKGWHKHGVCSESLWTEFKMPTPPSDVDPEDDWWLDAVRRPLGAYYRVDPQSVTDMHIALNESGILYASAICHSGWFADTAASVPAKGEWWEIPRQTANIADGGHAFVIVGYTSAGFIIQSSWGAEWGTSGRALLTYQDWLDNAMDCWVVQLGVVTDLRLKIAASTTLRVEAGKVQLATTTTLRNRELSPFIINMENNGHLSNTGEFRTQDSDVEALVDHHLGKARENWNLSDTEPVDIAIYAHGGLTSEHDAADTAAKWIPKLYDERIFPIFLMWETDLWSTLKNRISDIVTDPLRPTGGLRDRARKWWNERLEILLRVPGTAFWNEMKQNADAISDSPQGGGIKLYNACMESRWFKSPSQVRIHLIGHSAGAIVHSYLIDRLAQKGWKFETVTFLAPAVRVDAFEQSVLPAIKSKKIKQFNQFHLTDEAEQADTTCTPILGYSRSLLYLVSRSFEEGVTTEILGLEHDFNNRVKNLKLPNVQSWSAPSQVTRSSTHGGFDDDDTTISSVINLIQGKSP